MSPTDPPEHVELVGWLDENTPLLVCRSPKHEKPRDYAGRVGERGLECPLCAALSLYPPTERPATA